MGAIDEKYDIAISTACGALDKIAVPNLGSENVVILSNSLSPRVKDVFAL